MPEINQPTPIKPAWPTRREDRPSRRRPQEVPEGDHESKADDPQERSGGKEDDGHKIDDYA